MGNLANFPTVRKLLPTIGYIICLIKGQVSFFLFSSLSHFVPLFPPTSTVSNNNHSTSSPPRVNGSDTITTTQRGKYIHNHHGGDGKWQRQHLHRNYAPFQADDDNGQHHTPFHGSRNPKPPSFLK